MVAVGGGNPREVAIVYIWLECWRNMSTGNYSLQKILGIILCD